MATNWESVDVGCPFFRATDGSFIRCEGIAGVSVTMIFTGRQERFAFLEQHCNCRWAECPLHKAIADKYG